MCIFARPLQFAFSCVGLQGQHEKPNHSQYGKQGKRCDCEMNPKEKGRMRKFKQENYDHILMNISLTFC